MLLGDGFCQIGQKSYNQLGAEYASTMVEGIAFKFATSGVESLGKERVIYAISGAIDRARNKCYNIMPQFFNKYANGYYFPY